MKILVSVLSNFFLIRKFTINAYRVYNFSFRIGSRIWFNKPLSKTNSIGKDFGLSFSRSGSATKSRLCFAIQGVTVAGEILNIKIKTHSSNPKAMKLETEMHLHGARNQTIGRRFITKETVFELQDTEGTVLLLFWQTLMIKILENILDISLDLGVEAVKSIVLDSDEYVVITLLGHIHCWTFLIPKHYQQPNIPVLTSSSSLTLIISAFLLLSQFKKIFKALAIVLFSFAYFVILFITYLHTVSIVILLIIAFHIFLFLKSFNKPQKMQLLCLYKNSYTYFYHDYTLTLDKKK